MILPPSSPPPPKLDLKDLIKHLNTPAIAFRVERADERGYYLAHLRRKPLKERKDKDASGSPIINGLKGSFTGDSLIIWGIGGGATLAVYPADDSIREYVIRTSPLGDPCQGISDWGERVAIFSFIPFLAIGECGGKPRELKVAYALIEAHLLAGAITQGLKFGIGRERPDGGDHSFPSGHTSASFTFASVIAEFYGVKGGIPAYLLASLVALSRIELNKHHPSDVIFGATIGIAVGRAFARANMDKKEKKSSLLIPYPRRGGGGVALLIRF